ncbi:hypothetical protein K438DRAFT_1757301 [Mycena galopus ATCC 62051]|nr:hypothetical protein K438DRAFT_1757301 [Mycena galopus ATCC 62051]
MLRDGGGYPDCAEPKVKCEKHWVLLQEPDNFHMLDGPRKCAARNLMAGGHETDRESYGLVGPEEWRGVVGEESVPAGATAPLQQSMTRWCGHWSSGDGSALNFACWKTRRLWPLSQAPYAQADERKPLLRTCTKGGLRAVHACQVPSLAGIIVR